ncbi:MAG: hypothetical protein HQ521_22020 [Bacteroidetes bacterium]|nr:hypothetical protein [Bacteroidota bacterium]
MNNQDINALIDRYYEGSLSVEVEESLFDFLKNNDDPKYAEIKMQINALNILFDDEEILDDEFDEKLLEKLSAFEPTRIARFNINRILSGIAATVLILITIWIASNILSSKEVYGTVNDPQIAFAETKKALQKVSGNVKKGVIPAATSMKKVETSLENTKKVTKATDAIKQVQKINKLNETGELLKLMTKVTVKSGKS